MYENLLKILPSILEGENNPISNMSNFSSLLFHFMKNVNWVGFYIKDNNNLILGPFQGKTACVRIEIGKGVCGKSAELFQTIIVDDVNNFPGHIACDVESRSEIVIPLILENELFGVLDIDSYVYSNFDNNDKIGLENLLESFVKLTELKKLKHLYSI